MGTTGAAMLLIRPLIAANAHRRYDMHTFVFFIFIVANIAGSLTPLGDPPLFLGFLRGVDFFLDGRAFNFADADGCGPFAGAVFCDGQRSSIKKRMSSYLRKAPAPKSRLAWKQN